MHYKFVCHSSLLRKLESSLCFSTCLQLSSSSRTEYIFNCDLRCDHPMVFNVPYKKGGWKPHKRAWFYKYATKLFFLAYDFYEAKYKLGLQCCDMRSSFEERGSQVCKVEIAQDVFLCSIGNHVFPCWRPTFTFCFPVSQIRPSSDVMTKWRREEAPLHKISLIINNMRRMPI